MTRQRVVYWLHDAPSENAAQAMQRMAKALGFRVLGAIPQSVADQWWFWIEYEGERPPLPHYVVDADWRPIGCA